MTVKTFVDSNILLYVHDHDAGWKQHVCKQRVMDLWQQKNVVISTQVLQEFYNIVTRKFSQPMSYAKARTYLEFYSNWEVVQINPTMIQTASEIQERYQLSFWDSLIIAAAQQAKAEVLLSEDMNHGQVVGGVEIQNPMQHQVQEDVALYQV